jgi:hypothetical protein
MYDKHFSHLQHVNIPYIHKSSDKNKTNLELTTKYLYDNQEIPLIIDHNSNYKKISVNKNICVRINCDWINNSVPYESIFSFSTKSIIFGNSFNNIINVNCLPTLLKN